MATFAPSILIFILTSLLFAICVAIYYVSKKIFNTYVRINALIRERQAILQSLADSASEIEATYSLLLSARDRLRSQNTQCVHVQSPVVAEQKKMPGLEHRSKLEVGTSNISIASCVSALSESRAPDCGSQSD